jgi:hypothetical protein
MIAIEDNKECEKFEDSIIPENVNKIVEAINQYENEIRKTSFYSHPAFPISRKTEILVDYYKMTEQFIFECSFAIPNKKAIDIITKYSPLIEIGAGTGFWSSLIAKNGGDIIAFDNNEEDRWKNKHFTITLGDENKITEYPERILFLCWPPYWNDMAINSVKMYKGEFIIYIGESYGGCTATDEFFDYIHAYFEQIDGCSIPQRRGIHDSLSVWKRR